jgi:hypothetical protein
LCPLCDPLQELIKLCERKNLRRFGAERHSSTIDREPEHAASGPLQELIKLCERKNLRRFGAERHSSTIDREPEHAASGPLQELIKLREGRLAGGLERSDIAAR